MARMARDIVQVPRVTTREDGKDGKEFWIPADTPETVLPESHHINSGGSGFLPQDSGIKESMGTGLLLTCVNI